MKAVLEKVITEDESSIRAFKYSADEFDAPWHIHPEYELTYILKSTGIRYIGNNISDYQTGELVLIGPNLPHCWKNEEHQNEKAESLVIQWPAELSNSLLQYRVIQHVMSNSGRGVLFRNADSIEIVKKMQAIIDASGLNRFVRFAELLQTMDQLKDKVILAGESYAYDQSNETTDRIETVQNYVDQHFSQKIKLIDVANQLNMTEQSFSRFFSKIMQRPFFVYLNEYRVNRASRLLLETDLQVAEIGYKCGYESLPFFYQQFKKFKGYSPLGFRKMYRRIK
ncbi:AraC family transcriptional regulator [Reichenbachiella versicolor]|uniref:AraC family transcriptional regulator n=1 Tax=Reichenbachiella versicolor TaxID=1821036 RepID=UPI000D6EA731|nr:AraC family transcriptional regulator [Reichenbachiella versicolor]